LTSAPEQAKFRYVTVIEPFSTLSRASSAGHAFIPRSHCSSAQDPLRVLPPSPDVKESPTAAMSTSRNVLSVATLAGTPAASVTVIVIRQRPSARRKIVRAQVPGPGSDGTLTAGSGWPSTAWPSSGSRVQDGLGLVLSGPMVWPSTTESHPLSRICHWRGLT
jgi:hypothetical protein